MLASRQQYWIFQFVGWSVWVLMLILRDLIIVPPEYIFPRALVFSFSAITAIAVTTGLGGGSPRNVVRAITPEIHHPNSGNALYVFKLKSR